MRNLNPVEIDQQRKYSLLKVFFTLSLLVHILLILFFLYLKYYDLLLLMLFNSCIFVINLLLLEKLFQPLSNRFGDNYHQLILAQAKLESI
jgi:hypothetical protein